MVEIPPPTYGYMRRDDFDDFRIGSMGDNLLKECAPYAPRAMIYTGEIGRNTSADTFICQLPWEGVENICACRLHMRYTRGVVYKE